MAGPRLGQRKGPGASHTRRAQEILCLYHLSPPCEQEEWTWALLFLPDLWCRPSQPSNRPVGPRKTSPLTPDLGTSHPRSECKV